MMSKRLGNLILRENVIIRMPFRRCIRSLSSNAKNGLGLGLGNVHDPMLGDSSKFRHFEEPKMVSIIGAPMTYGQPYCGTDHGPTLLREAGLLSKLTQLGWRVKDIGNIPIKSPGVTTADLQQSGGNAKNSALVGAFSSRLSIIVEESVSAGAFALTLGGDHSVAFGSLSGVLRARPSTGILWIDAHADLNTPQTSGSGNLHGMPLGFLVDGVVKPDYTSVPGLDWTTEEGAPRLRPDSIVYVGLRDVDAGEREAIKRLGIRAYTMTDIDHYGIGAVMDRALGHLTKDDPDRPIHISYDIDVVDPAHAPATGTAVRGGLSFREAHYVAEAAAASGLLISADLVELNPTLTDGHGADETIDLSLQIITSLLGKSII